MTKTRITFTLQTVSRTSHVPIRIRKLEDFVYSSCLTFI
jgi:hypothetical protein